MPPEVQEQLVAAEKSRNKMHQLYMHYVSCRGEWERCSLVVSIRKQTAHTSDEVYEWWDEKKMKSELGEDLAVDLMKRHADAESKLSAAEKGKFIRVCFALHSAQVLSFQSPLNIRSHAARE